MTPRKWPRDAGSAKAKVGLTMLVGILLWVLYAMLIDGDSTTVLTNPFDQNDSASQNGEPGRPGGDSSARREEGGKPETDSNRTDREFDPERAAAAREELEEGGKRAPARGVGLTPLSPGGPDGSGAESRGAEKAEKKSPEELLKAELQPVRAELRELGDAMLQATRSLDARLDQLERDQDAMNRRLNRMNTALEAMERRVFEHRATIARLERDIRQPGGRFDMGDPVALAPRRLYRNAPLKLFEGQVLIHLTGFHARDAGFPAANFEITLPMLDLIVLDDVGIGDRRVFHYAGREFFLEVLGTDGQTWARVVITRKLPD
ncbi:MAG: hypothetical protein ACLFRG_07485 [Desulfococcaceae bacterium]